MEITRSILLASCALMLVGCCTAPCTPTPCNGSDNASVQLAEAATSISQSLTDLTAIEKTEAPPVNNKSMPFPMSYDMDQMVAMDWSGPIEPLLQRISYMSNYNLRVIGVRPPIPVLVTIYAKNTPLGYILRDANFQAASKANIMVYPGIRVIELRYAQS